MKGIRKKGNKWYYNLTYTDITGIKHRIERAGGNTAKEARNALKKAQESIYNIKQTSINATTVFEQFLQLKKETRKITTYNRYTQLYNQYIKDNINTDITNINVLTITKILNNAKNKKLSNTTIQSIYQLLNTYFKYCYKNRYININPCDFIDRPKRDTKQYTALSANEVSLLLKYTSNQAKIKNINKQSYYIMYIAIYTALETGLRRGELSALTWDNIDITNNKISIQKNLVYSQGHTIMTTPKTSTSIRDIVISQNLTNILLEYKSWQSKNMLKYGKDYIQPVFDNQTQDIVWRWETGQNVHPDYFRKALQKICKEADLQHIRWHDLRHTNATLLYRQGIDFKLIQTRLGHSDINITLNIYSHVDEQQQNKAVTALNAILQ